MKIKVSPSLYSKTPDPLFTWSLIGQVFAYSSADDLGTPMVDWLRMGYGGLYQCSVTYLTLVSTGNKQNVCLSGPLASTPLQPQKKSTSPTGSLLVYRPLGIRGRELGVWVYLQHLRTLRVCCKLRQLR